MKYLVILLLTLCACGQPQPPVGPNDQLSPGQAVVYSGTFSRASGDQPLRIVKAGDCFITEVLEYGKWQVANWTFTSSIECGGAQPEPPK